MKIIGLTAIVLCITATPAWADRAITVHRVDKQEGVGQTLGTITVRESEYGLVFTPALEKMGDESGMHGFHVHENPNCEPTQEAGRLEPAGAAGDHYDRRGIGAHGAPWGEGHLGDLPSLYVKSDGTASHPVLAPRLSMVDIDGRSLIIHAGMDDYDERTGGDPIACGVIGDLSKQ